MAILKQLGANSDIMDRRIFDQEQISRAVQLGLGVASPSQMELIADDTASRAYASQLETILKKG